MAVENFDLLVIGGIVISTILTIAAGYRVIRGPTVPDRVVGLDTIGTNVVAIVALFALYTRQGFYVNAAVVLAIIGFLSTVAVAKYILEEDMIE